MAVPSSSALEKLSSECGEAFATLLENIPTQSRSGWGSDDSWLHAGDMGSFQRPAAQEIISSLQHEQTRFNFWTGAIGAFASGRTSLDFRLMYHHATRDKCTLHLKKLHNDLFRCKLLSGLFDLSAWFLTAYSSREQRRI